MKQGAPWALGCMAPRKTCLDARLQARILKALEDRLFAAVGLAPICASFSTAVTPPIRNAQFPEASLTCQRLLPWRSVRAMRMRRSSFSSLPRRYPSLAGKDQDGAASGRLP